MKRTLQDLTSTNNEGLVKEIQLLKERIRQQEVECTQHRKEHSLKQKELS